MNSFLLWIGGLLVAVLGLLFAVPHLVDWNAYRGVFEEEASRILGRDVRVGGQVNLRLLPSPYVRFEKVRISDAGAALGEPFFRAEAFTLWLSPTPLLKGAVEASELELDRPVLRLAVDAEGRGNWQALNVTPGSVPFVPSDVVLQQVRIRGGIVSLRTPGVSEPLALSGIDGEVSAASLDGPYRFRGMVDWYGSRRELRIGTSQRETDGKLRYKASVRVPGSGNNYAIDGMLSELSTRARHTGTLTAKLPLAGMLGGLLAGDANARVGRGGDAIDLKATIEGNLDGARLSDMTFAFEQGGKPQLVSGELTAAWRGGLRVDTRLAARWLDLDHLIGQGSEKAAPVDVIRRIIGQASSTLANEGTSLLTIDVDQVNLGGEALSGVRLALARAGGLTSIGELRAALPGGARGELRGTLGGAAAAVRDDTARPQPGIDNAFDGEVVVHGASYQRFAAWAGITALAPVQDGRSNGDKTRAPRPDEAFSLASRVRLMNDGLSLAGAQLELGGRQVTGGVEWRWAKEPSLEIKASGRKVDISPFAAGSLDLTKSGDSGGAGEQSVETGFTALARLAGHAAAIERAVGRFRLVLEAGELSDGTSTLREVDGDLSVGGGAVSVAALRFTGQAGARVDLQGEVTGLQSKPAGNLRGWAAADNPEATRALLAVLPTGVRPLAGRWLTEARKTETGFTLTLGGATPDVVTLSARGMVDAATTTVELGLDGGLARWREAPIRLALDVDGQSAAAVVRRMGGIGAPLGSGAGPTGRAALSLRASGANASSLITVARLEAGSGQEVARADYQGRLALTTSGDVEIAGEVSLNAPAAGELLMLAGARRRPLLAGVGARGKLGIERKAGVTTLAARGLDIGGSRVGGRIALSTRAERTRIDGQLTTDRLSVAGLMGMILDGEARPAEDDAANPAAAGGSPWPDAPLSLALLDGSEGLITIAAPVATLPAGLEITDAQARLAFGPQRVEIQSLAGAALGGRFTARGTIEGAAAGAGVSLEARVTGAQLGQLVGGAVDASSGEANATLSITARALSPRAVMSSAVGKGELEIRNGRVRGIGAAIVEKAAAAAIEGSDPVDRAALERILRAERVRSVTPLGNRKLSLDVVDGALRVGAIEIVASEANLRNVTTVDLVQLRADSEWQIVPRRGLPETVRGRSQRNDPLPAVSVVWTGSLGSIARGEPRLTVDSLEREISIRKMERDAEKLEEIKRQDEEHMRLEAERQKRLLDGGERGGDAAPAPGATPAAAPVIEAPFPLPKQTQAVPPVADPPAKGADVQPPRVVRPPAKPRAQTKSLEDLLMGQQ